jgi:release factor glutamine methyltransferase
MSTLETTRISHLDELASSHDASHSSSAALFRAMLDQLSARWHPFPDKPEETPSTIVRALWLCAADRACSCELAANGELPDLTLTQASHLATLFQMKLQGVPLAHLIGRQRFMGLELLAGPEALIPRKETEILAGAALAAIRSVVAAHGFASVMDICTGCGNLPLAYAAHVPACRVVAADLSEEAIELACQNARHLQLSHRVAFRTGDLFAPFHTPDFLNNVDVITCNPPYISSAKLPTMAREIADFEPSMAFDGGPLGVTILLRVIAQAPLYLKSGGYLGLEVGLGQGPATCRLLANARYSDIRTFNDAAGQIRAILAQVVRR